MEKMILKPVEHIFVEHIEPVKPNRLKTMLHKAKKTIQTKKLNYFLIKK